MEHLIQLNCFEFLTPPTPPHPHTHTHTPFFLCASGCVVISTSLLAPLPPSSLFISLCFSCLPPPPPTFCFYLTSEEQSQNFQPQVPLFFLAENLILLKHGPAAVDALHWRRRHCQHRRHMPLGPKARKEVWDVMCLKCIWIKTCHNMLSFLEARARTWSTCLPVSSPLRQHQKRGSMHFKSAFNRETGIHVAASDPHTSPSPSVSFFY